MMRAAARAPLFPYTTLFRSSFYGVGGEEILAHGYAEAGPVRDFDLPVLNRERLLDEIVQQRVGAERVFDDEARSEEHTSELQSQFHVVCRLLREKKNLAEPR